MEGLLVRESVPCDIVRRRCLLLSSMEIKLGRRLEVLWEIGSAPKKTSVWWGAIVCSVAMPSASSAPVSATIRYDALHGYEESDSKVSFITESLLEPVEEGKRHARHPWRWAVAHHLDEGSSAEGTLRGSGIETPRVQRGGDVSRVQDVDYLGSDPNRSHYSDLSGRVYALERQVQLLKTQLRSSEMETVSKCCRTLLFAKHRLGMELDKPIPGTSSSLSKYRDAHTVSQSVVSVQVDCTLEEFEDITKLTTTRAGKSIRVHPRMPISNSCRVPSSYSIILESYADLCKALGVACMEDIAGTIIKKKIDRRDNAPVSVRAIGGLRRQHRSSEGPMILAIGSSIDEDGEFGGPLHVLFRKSQVWDSVEGSFAEPLVARTMIPSEIDANFGADDTTSLSATVLDETEGSRSLLQLTWVRTSVLREALFEAGKSDTVLGSLSISVPVVIFRGLSLCAEVEEVCTERFIEASIQ